jgi:hypothetical protein
MVLDDPGPMGVLGNPRCKRFCMYTTALPLERDPLWKLLY